LHKAMKYGIWTSLGRNNEIFNEAFEKSLTNRSNVYFIFSPIDIDKIYGDLHSVVGVAKMIS